MLVQDDDISNLPRTRKKEKLLSINLHRKGFEATIMIIQPRKIRAGSHLTVKRRRVSNAVAGNSISKKITDGPSSSKSASLGAVNVTNRQK